MGYHKGSHPGNMRTGHGRSLVIVVLVIDNGTADQMTFFTSLPGAAISTHAP